MPPRRLDWSLAPKRLNLGSSKSRKLGKKVASLIVKKGEGDARELALSLVSQKRTRVKTMENPLLSVGECKKSSTSMVLEHISPGVAMLQELVTPGMYEEDRRMSLLEMLLVLLRAFSKIDEMEAELNASKVKMAEILEAMVAREGWTEHYKGGNDVSHNILLEAKPDVDVSFLPYHYQTELEKFKAKSSGSDASTKGVAKVSPNPKDTLVPSPRP
ncbi:hypothetical protein Pint_05090 [Pistacia integerrima]|uniref:Uncharacterized protein n=1 Tax=Pistacia integerrima TaxID=434235 RepID=A0ACC0Z8T2_9ROSI|nr:hypothetical protein Pint_05090 [Pistacia integerrima]